MVVEGFAYTTEDALPGYQHPRSRYPRPYHRAIGSICHCRNQSPESFPRGQEEILNLSVYVPWQKNAAPPSSEIALHRRDPGASEEGGVEARSCYRGDVCAPA